LHQHKESALLELLHKKRSSRQSLHSRRQAIERCLAAFGVLGEAGRPARRANRDDMQSTRLRTALENLGPVFAAFGIYMASRIDLLLVRDRFVLAAIADGAVATPSATVRELLAREIGSSLTEVYAVFEDEPCESRLFFQSHRARLHDGKAVIVKVIHPELQDSLSCDLELLPVLQSAFAGMLWRGTAIEDAITDFRRTMQWHMNLLSGVKVFEMLARDAQEFAMLHVPAVYKELCSAQMLTIEEVPGTSLREMMTSYEQIERGRESLVLGDTGIEPHTFARRLCMVWLRQALLGKQFPVALRPEDIVLLPTQQIAFTGGVFASMPADAKKNLWHYMMATSTEAPDRACAALLREMEQEGQCIDEEELRYRFREIVPFRDGGWRGSSDSSSLTEHLFVHWKLVSERGLRPQRHLLCFYRGLFQTLALVRQFAPDRDPLLEGLQDVRTIVMLDQFQEMLEWHTLSDRLDKYSTMMMELPHKFDNALTLMAESHTQLPLQGARSAPHHGQPNSSAVVMALLLMLVAVVLLSHHVAAAAIAGVWGDRISALAFVIFGALLLRAVSRA
jgi:predicted unusual protein kinase regulating ubiquinone biosynthesis (AarF/ABC1/UbiB family)